MNHTSLFQLQQDLNAGNVTCQQVVKHYLLNIKNNQHLNAFLEVYEEEALERATALDQKIKTGSQG